MTAYDISRLSQVGRLQEALTACLQAIRNGTYDSNLFYLAAEIALRLGDLEKAEQLVGRLLALDPAHLNGWVLFGKVYERKKDLARAAYGRQRAIELFPALAQLDTFKTAATQEKPRAEEAPPSRPGVENPSFNTATFAEICISQGYLNKALAVYNELLRKAPQETRYRKKIEEIEARLKRNDKSKN